MNTRMRNSAHYTSFMPGNRSSTALDCHLNFMKDASKHTCCQAICCLDMINLLLKAIGDIVHKIIAK